MYANSKKVSWICNGNKWNVSSFKDSNICINNAIRRINMGLLDFIFGTNKNEDINVKKQAIQREDMDFMRNSMIMAM